MNHTPLSPGPLLSLLGLPLYGSGAELCRAETVRGDGARNPAEMGEAGEGEDDGEEPGVEPASLRFRSLISLITLRKDPRR